MPGRLVVTDHAFKHLDRERRAAERSGAEFAAYQCVDEEQTVAAAEGADVLITNFAPITAGVLRAMNSGGAVVRYGIGYDNVDVDAATRLGVTVANVPDYGIDTVADHSAASILTLTRQLPSYTHLIRENGWSRPAEVGDMPALSSLTVGFVGFGRIARALHSRLMPFGFDFLAHDPVIKSPGSEVAGVELVPLAELAQRSHIVSLHAPSTETTRGMVNDHFLGLMPPGSIIVNTARGSLIDTDALERALESGRLRGAALDVTDPEPLPQRSKLRTMSNVILTPHAAFYDEESLARLQQYASDEAERALAGRPLRNPVNAQDGESQ